MRTLKSMSTKCWAVRQRIIWIFSIFAAMGIGINIAIADEAAVRQSVQKILPDDSIASIILSPVPGLYEVTAGSRVFYMSADGRYLFHGNLLDVNTRKNLTKIRRDALKQTALSKLPQTPMVVFTPPNPKHTITVFTDIDCGYCRKLHREIGEFMAKGIKVQYLLYPRAGVNSKSYTKSVNVWCSKDRNQALTDAKAGKTLPNLTCDNPVQKHMKLGELMGIAGTPSIILENGRILPGYVPAQRLENYLSGTKK